MDQPHSDYVKNLNFLSFLSCSYARKQCFFIWQNESQGIQITSYCCFKLCIFGSYRILMEYFAKDKISFLISFYPILRVFFSFIWIFDKQQLMLWFMLRAININMYNGRCKFHSKQDLSCSIYYSVVYWLPLTTMVSSSIHFHCCSEKSMCCTTFG